MSETTAVAAPEREAAADRSAAIASWSFVAALATVVVAGAVALWRFQEWVPVSDLAVLELRLREIPESLPLVGAYSRFGWSHPGPLFEYLMWVPWRLFGGVGVGLLAGMLLLHLAALVLAWFAARSVDLGAAVMATAALLVVWAGAPPSAPLIPWNPMVGMLLGGTLLVIAWNAAIRGRWGAAALLPVGTLLVQAHVGTALLVLAVSVVAVALAIVPTGLAVAAPRRIWLTSLAVTAVLWLPVVWQQIQPDGGNLTAILTGSRQEGRSVASALTPIADAFSLTPYWWRPDPNFLPDQAGIPVLLILPIAATVMAVVRRDAVMLRLVGVGAAALVASFVSVARISEPFGYLVSWLPGVVVVVLGLSVWILFAGSGLSPWILRLAPVLLLIPALLLAMTMWVAPPPKDAQSARVAVAAGAVTAAGSGGVHLTVEPGEGALEWLPGMIAVLQQDSVPVTADVPGVWPEQLRQSFPTDPVGYQDVRVEVFTQRPGPPPDGWRALAQDDPFTPAEWVELERQDAVAADPRATADERALAAFAAAEVRADRVAWRVLVADAGE